MHPFPLLVATLLLVANLPAAQAQEIWGALVLGTSQEHPPDPPEELQPFAASLYKVFGYNRLDLMGQNARTLEKKGECWVIPSKELFLRVRSKRAARNRHELNLQLYHGKKLLVESEARLAPGKPLLIRGPEWGVGQLIILLVVR